MATANILRSARARIADRKNWTTGYMARTADGTACFAESPEAVSWCALGALAAESGTGGLNVDGWELLIEASRKLYCTDSVSSVNNCEGHLAVLGLYDAAIAAAEAEAR